MPGYYSEFVAGGSCVVRFRENKLRRSDTSEHLLNIINKIDPEFFDRITSANRFVFSEGALPKKYKLLIALAFDTAHGAFQEVKVLAQEAS